jgi:hypothetical protein
VTGRRGALRSVVGAHAPCFGGAGADSQVGDVLRTNCETNCATVFFLPERAKPLAAVLLKGTEARGIVP